MRTVNLPRVGIGAYGAIVRKLDYEALCLRWYRRNRNIDRLKRELSAELQRSEIEWKAICDMAPSSPPAPEPETDEEWERGIERAGQEELAERAEAAEDEDIARHMREGRL